MKESKTKQVLCIKGLKEVSIDILTFKVKIKKGEIFKLYTIGKKEYIITTGFSPAITDIITINIAKYKDNFKVMDNPDYKYKLG